ncbi:hypothetical protein [Streptomyces sp. NPDC007883]|uniref:hypothetical protein n=1 Tax=Streptomyces sp. NPDC007883 TaxID=3155116 RepID=UPI0033E60F31
MKTPPRTYPDAIVVGAAVDVPGRAPGPGPSVPGAVVPGRGLSVSGGDAIVVGAAVDVPGRAPGPGPSVPGAVVSGRGLSVSGGDAPGHGGSPRGARPEVHGAGSGGRERVEARTVRGALPAMDPPPQPNRFTGIPRRLSVRGGHRPTGTVRGAPASGTRAARVGLAGRAR